MALYQDGILISGANTLPKMTLAEYNALPADQRPTYWERLDGDYDDVLAPKTDIATVESGTTASRAYSVGELVYVSGTLYRVKTAIASGATFTVGTNIEVTNVSNAIHDINGIIKVSTITKSVTTTASTQTDVRIDVPQISEYKAIGIVSYNIPLTTAVVQPSIVSINDAGTSVTMRFVTNLSTTVTVSCKVMYVKNGFYS